jgi:hypothetical protein
MYRLRWYALLAVCLMQLGSAQETAPSQPPLDLGVTFSTTVTEPLFGTTTVMLTGLKGDIYKLKPQTPVLPNFKNLKPIGTIYNNGLNVRPRLFTEGFPGVADLIEWFAIDYTGKFYVTEQGKYDWVLISDDGSKLYIDGHAVIDNDGIHSTRPMRGSIELSGGMHTIRISYFQGSRYALALVLAVRLPGQKDYRIFNTSEFQPTPNPDDWKVAPAARPYQLSPSPAGFTQNSAPSGQLSGDWKSPSGAILSIEDHGDKIKITNLTRPDIKYDARREGDFVIAVAYSSRGHGQGAVLSMKDAVHLQVALFPYSASDSKDATLKMASKALKSAHLIWVRVD